MVNLTFGEQVKIILSRRRMTIKELAERVEEYTGKPMSRQNMTQRLGRDNFQEQDMRMIAEILGCTFTLNIMEPAAEQEEVSEAKPESPVAEDTYRQRTYELKLSNKEVGSVNPYTQKEYESNSVRMHPSRIGYVQVYDREQHKWAEMTEWAFLGYQERKKKLLGKDYKPPIYLD